MKQLLIFLFFLCSASVSAQDVIVKKDGSTIVCRVVELTSSEIVYKKWSDLNGSNYVMNRADASAINYENGKKVNLSEVDNQYQPHNQNTGKQQYNDNALLAIDRASHPKWKRNFKCNLRAAYAIDFYNTEYVESGSTFDVGAGLVFPLKDENMFVGGDFGLSTIRVTSKLIATYSYEDESASAPLLYLAPYWGYKFMIGKNTSIAPYVGPYVGVVADDDYANGIYIERNEFRFGLHLGARLFLSSNFYFDLHCMKNFNEVGEIAGNYGSGFIEKNYKLFSLILGIGVQF